MILLADHVPKAKLWNRGDCQIESFPMVAKHIHAKYLNE